MVSFLWLNWHGHRRRSYTADKARQQLLRQTWNNAAKVHASKAHNAARKKKSTGVIASSGATTKLKCMRSFKTLKLRRNMAGHVLCSAMAKHCWFLKEWRSRQKNKKRREKRILYGWRFVVWIVKNSPKCLHISHQTVLHTHIHTHTQVQLWC